MKYTLKKYPGSDTISLQGVGHVIGRPAVEVKAGDTLMWNFGEKETVLSVLSETVHFVTIQIQSSRSGYVGTRKLKKDRLVCILEP
jgi:hypothetical protein